MRKFVLTYGTEDFPKVVNKAVHALVNGYYDAQRYGVGKAQWRNTVQGANRKHEAKPWVDLLNNSNLQCNVLKQAFAVQDYFKLEKEVTIILNGGFGYLSLRPNAKDSDVSMSLEHTHPDFWFYKFLFRPILKELEDAGLGHYEEVEPESPAKAGNELSQESLDYLRQSDSCFF